MCDSLLLLVDPKIHVHFAQNIGCRLPQLPCYCDASYTIKTPLSHRPSSSEVPMTSKPACLQSARGEAAQQQATQSCTPACRRRMSRSSPRHARRSHSRAGPALRLLTPALPTACILPSSQQSNSPLLTQDALDFTINVLCGPCTNARLSRFVASDHSIALSGSYTEKDRDRIARPAPSPWSSGLYSALVLVATPPSPMSAASQNER